MEELKNQPCPVCNTNNLTLTQEEKDVKGYGKVFILSMHCSSCEYSKSDLESDQQSSPRKLTFTIEKEADLKVLMVKSASATIKIPQMRIELKASDSDEGYILTLEQFLAKIKKIIEEDKESEDDNIRKQAKNQLKKLWKVTLGDETLKIIIEDPSGISAILSDKTLIDKLK